MELIKRENRDGFIYSPIIKQYSTTFWKSVTGTPAMSGDVLRFTSATGASLGQFAYADVEFLLTVPVKPTAGDARVWGFKLPDTNALGAAYFDITNTAFTAVTYSRAGVAETTTLTWTDGTFSARAIPFRIRWDHDQVEFFVNGTKVATHSTSIPNLVKNLPLPLYIKNGNADNMDLTYLAVSDAASIV